MAALIGRVIAFGLMLTLIVAFGYGLIFLLREWSEYRRNNKELKREKTNTTSDIN